MANGSSNYYLTAACCSSYLVMGLLFSLIGVGLESFAAQTGGSAAEVGSLFFLCYGGGTFVMLFAVGPLIDRFGQRLVLIGGALICAVGTWLLRGSDSMLGACALMFLMGTGSAGLNAGSNTLINYVYQGNSERPLNLVNLFYGLGAVAMPLAGGWLISGAGFDVLLKLAAAGCLLPVVMFSVAKFPGGVVVDEFSLIHAGREARDTLVILFAVVMFIYVGLEASLGIWSRTSVIERWGLEPPLDQWLLAGYWAALMIGRILVISLFHEIPGRKLVLRCALGSFAGLTVFAFANTLWLAAFSLWFSGLCFGPIFPSALGSAGRVFLRYTGTIFAVIIAAGLLGGISITAAVGAMAGAGSLNAGLIFVAVSAGIMLFIQLKISRGVERRLQARDSAADKQ